MSIKRFSLFTLAFLLLCKNVTLDNTTDTLWSRDLYMCGDVLPIILHLINWKDVVFFYDSHHDHDILQAVLRLHHGVASLNYVPKTSAVFDVRSLTPSEMNVMLLTVYSNVKAELYVIVTPDVDLLQLFQVADNVDSLSNKTTNFRSNSKWIILHNALQETSFPFKLMHVLFIKCNLQYTHLQTVVNNALSELNCRLESNVSYGPDEMPLLYHNETIHCSVEDFFPQSRYKLGGRHILIGTIESVSAFDIRLDQRNKTVYSGVNVDVAELLAQWLNFTYTFVQPADCKWGIKINGEWGGLIGQLERQEVDMIIADIVANVERQQVVDFIFPAFLRPHIGILYRKGNEAQVNNLLKIFSPFHQYVYYCLLATIVFIGGMIVCLDRKDSVELITFTRILISLWGFLLLREYSFLPRKESVRILVIFFWMFCLIISGIFVGNLTAKLAEKKTVKPFKSLKELANLHDWRWGSSDEMTQGLIQRDSSPGMKEIWEGMVRFNRTDPGVFRLDYNYHMARLHNPEEKYAYIVLDAKYFAVNKKNCSLEIFDKVISSLHQAVAVTKHSYLKSEVERALLDLSLIGVLQKLEEEHSHDNRPLSCRTIHKSAQVAMPDMYGTVVVCSIGIGIALTVLLLEVVYLHAKN